MVGEAAAARLEALTTRGPSLGLRGLLQGTTEDAVFTLPNPLDVWSPIFDPFEKREEEGRRMRSTRVGVVR